MRDVCDAGLVRSQPKEGSPTDGVLRHSTTNQHDEVKVMQRRKRTRPMNGGTVGMLETQELLQGWKALGCCALREVSQGLAVIKVFRPKRSRGVCCSGL